MRVSRGSIPLIFLRLPDVLPPPVRLQPPELLVHAVSDGKRLGLATSGVSGVASALKRAGACWNPVRRMGVVEADDPKRVLARLQALYAGQFVGFEDAPGVLAAALAAPKADYFAQVLDVQVFPLAKGGFSRGRHAVSFDYDTCGPCGPCGRCMAGFIGRPAHGRSKATWIVFCRH